MKARSLVAELLRTVEDAEKRRLKKIRIDVPVLRELAERAERLASALRAAKEDRAYQQLTGGAHFTSAPTEQEWKHESAQKAWALVDAALAKWDREH